MKLPYFYAVCNAVIIGLSFLFLKQALQYSNPLDTLTFRFTASFVVMSIPVLFGWVKLSYRDKPIRKILLLATMYPLGFFTLQAFGLLFATSAEGGILYAFTPIVTMLIAAVCLKEKTTLLQKMSIFLSVFGVVLIFLMQGTRLDLANMLGISLLLLTCVAFAGYTVLARSLTAYFSPAEVTYAMMTIACAVFLTLSLLRHGSAGTFHEWVAPLANGTFVIAIVYLGIVSSLVTALLSNYILSRMEASRMSVFANLSTIVSMAAGAMFLGEEVTLYHWAGSALIIAGVVGTQLLRQRPEKERPRQETQHSRP